MPAKRVTLTDDQLRDHTAQELLALLENISADGILTDDEILRLDSWLHNAGQANIPALTYLRAVVSGVLADRLIIEEERKTIVAAILRIMPPEKSALAKVRFSEAEKHGHEAAAWELKEKQAAAAATPEQTRFLQAMGVSVPEGYTEAAASDRIASELGSGQPVTVRQIMLLRFWDRLDLADKGRTAVDEWIDGWYTEAPDRLEAWELWKSENGDCGRQDSPERVSVGAGKAYLERVNINARETKPQQPMAFRVAMTILAALFLALAMYAIYRTK